MKRKGRKGFGWKRWSKEEIYEKWGLYQDYRIRYLYLKAAPSR
jgi:RNA-directed DNA polymerase